MFRFVCVMVGYLFGCINFAYIIGKTREKIDIRDYGSGNLGATNAIRVMGIKLGGLTLVGDFAKAVLAMVVMTQIYPNEVAAIYTGFGVILGHNWPVFLGFKGGKGIASTLGILMYIHPVICGCMILLMILIMKISKYMSLASIIMNIVASITVLLVIPNKEVGCVFAIIAVLGVYRHRPNIVRLMNGTENKLGEKK